jgi:hypothetical protein
MATSKPCHCEAFLKAEAIQKIDTQCHPGKCEAFIRDPGNYYHDNNFSGLLRLRLAMTYPPPRHPSEKVNLDSSNAK